MPLGRAGIQLLGTPYSVLTWSQLWGLLGTCLLHVPVVLLCYNIGVCDFWRPCDFSIQMTFRLFIGMFHFSLGKNKQWLEPYAKSCCLLPWLITSCVTAYKTIDVAMVLWTWCLVKNGLVVGNLTQRKKHNRTQLLVPIMQSPGL